MTNSCRAASTPNRVLNPPAATSDLAELNGEVCFQDAEEKRRQLDAQKDKMPKNAGGDRASDAANAGPVLVTGTAMPRPTSPEPKV